MKLSLPRGLSPLAHRNYSLYWAGLATTRFGRAVEEIGAVWLLYVLTGSPIALGVLGLARAVPAIIFGPIAGVVSDRVDQRRMLFVTQGMGLAASLVLGLLVATGRVEVWHVYLQVAIQASIETFDGSLRQALFPRLVPREQLPEAITLTSVAARVSTLLGPALGGVAIASLGTASPFLLNAATFLGLMGAVVLMRGVPKLAPRGVTTFRGELVEGIRHILDAPVLAGLLKLEVVFGIFQTSSVIITVVGTQVLGVGPEGLGVLLSAPALGALLGVVGLIAFGHVRRQGRLTITLTLVYAAVVLVFAFSTSFVLSFLVLAVMGLIDSVNTVTRHSVMQLAAPPHMRGRVMANMGTITRSTSPLSESQSGLLAGIFGGSAALVVAAAALLVAALTTAGRNRTLWEFRRDDPAEGLREAAAAEPADPGGPA
jgi:MFS family permease